MLRIRPDPEAGSQSRIQARKNKKIDDASPAVRAGRSGTMEYKAIPWDIRSNQPQSTSETLTINLALWWLHLLAADASGIEDNYSPLADKPHFPRTGDKRHGQHPERTYDPKITSPSEPPSQNAHLMTPSLSDRGSEPRARFSSAMPSRKSQLATPPSSGISKKRSRDDYVKTNDRPRRRTRTQY